MSEINVAAGMLSAHRIPFTSYNDGAHLVVAAKGELIDFWPDTGKWMRRGEPKVYLGVNKLISFCRNRTYLQRGAAPLTE